MSRHAAPAEPGSCGTCRDQFRITNSPVVDGICAWGHIAPEAWLAPRPGCAPLTTMEAASLLELLMAADDLASQVADVSRHNALAGDPSAIVELLSIGAMWEDFADLRADARKIFERTFFSVNP